MSFTANSTGGVYKTKHIHFTGVSFDGAGVYVTQCGKISNNDASSRTAEKRHALIVPHTIDSSKTREDGTEVTTLTNIQPSIVVYFWRRTA